MKDYSFLTKAVVKLEDVRQEFSSEDSMIGALSRLEKNGKIVKLKRGLYAVVNPITQDVFVNRFEIATALHDGAYCAYHTALEYYGLATQVYLDVHLITEKRYKPILIEDMEYHCFQSNYNEGVTEYKRNCKIRVTELERTVTDCLYRMKIAGGIEEVFMAMNVINYLDEEKLLKHLSGYQSKLIYKKAGYLFSLLKPKYLSDRFYEQCKENMPVRDDDIRENKRVDYVYDKEWKIYVPEQIMNTEN